MYKKYVKRYWKKEKKLIDDVFKNEIDAILQVNSNNNIFNKNSRVGNWRSRFPPSFPVAPRQTGHAAFPHPAS
jgi:hypothetical protein